MNRGDFRVGIGRNNGGGPEQATIRRLPGFPEPPKGQDRVVGNARASGLNRS